MGVSITFVDFETATAALPYHKGMSPYETVAFQWSCHTIRQPNAEPEHFGGLISNRNSQILNLQDH